MAFQISPGVNYSEVDLTTVVPSVLTTAGAFAGTFKWGPAQKRIPIDSEITLVSKFGTPDSNSATSFFTAASFLAYGNNLTVARAVGSASRNARANTSGTALQITNEDVFQAAYLSTTAASTIGPIIARYPGALGNSLAVGLIDVGGNFSTWNVNSIGVSSYFNGAPGTSTQASAAGAANDEVHIVVLDAGGLFTGVKNQVLEVFPYLSKGSDATDSLGNSNYINNVIYNNSKYIYSVSAQTTDLSYATWGRPLANTSYYVQGTNSFNLTGGSDDVPSTANTQTAYGLFANADETNVSLVITGDAPIATQQYVIDNLANSRKDCLAFISPPSANVVNQAGNETTNITAWNTALGRSTSYAVADSGWKYMFDKYNNTYRWIPLNGDIAGLCVYTDSVRDPWFSPAGFNRGNLKNVVKLAWNPTKTNRDTLYAQGINPVGTFPGNGTVLYGDKTLQTKPSAFDRINVRRLFIVLEKAISQAAKYSLFEFNDESTRAQFVGLVTPFLRDIQGRRGIYDFRVVCDTTNNTSQVIDSNQFVGDIYIKPARSINFIQLNFVAVRTGVDFTEVVGKF
jgi:phage tail sheath protein FI